MEDPNLLEKEFNKKLYQYLFIDNREKQIQIEIPYGKVLFYLEKKKFKWY